MATTVAAPSSRPPAAAYLTDLDARGQGLLGAQGKAIAQHQPLDLGAGAVPAPSRSGRCGASSRSACRHSASSSRPTSCSGSRPRPALVGRDAAHLLFVHGAAVRRPALDRDLHRLAAAARPSASAIAVQDPTTSYATLLAAGAAVRLRRRQLRLEHGEHQLLLPEGAQGLGARA